MAKHLNSTGAPEQDAAENAEVVEAKTAPLAAVNGEEEHKRLFEDFSFAQVLASSLSAVTSVLLSQQIGLIGGLLGVAVGAAVATIATQAYRSVLTVSAERLREQIIIAPPANTEGASESDETKKLAAEREQAAEIAEPGLRRAGTASCCLLFCIHKK